MASSFTSLPGMVKVVVALVASARVTLPSSTTHLSKTLPVSGASAVTVTTVFCAILSVMSVPAAREAVPLMNVSGRSGVLYEPCLAAVGTLAGVENSFALALFCRFAAVPVVAELINDMTVADNLSAAGCALLVAAIA